ncbi:hypothetical protein [Nocardia sp. NPDC052566]|uniref:hypothetical protein n=1 Tax=Nocardia sp. NPDC052566 TaxID=3364330 RepID=UPI0037CC8046
MHKTRTALVAAMAASALVLTACGSETAAPANQPIPATQTAAPAPPAGAVTTKTDAAELRSQLTYLLTQHVYQAGITLKFAVEKGGNLNDPTVKAAVAALDHNSVELSKAVGAAYPDAEKPFLDSWRQHIGFFVDYTLGKATKNQAKVDKAKTDLDGYRSSFGQLINSVVAELPAQAVADELKPHVASLFSTIDSLVANDGQAFSTLVDAADHMPMTASILAGGIAKNKKLSGDPAAKGSELRAQLTYLLTSHVDLAAIALAQAVAKGGNLNEPSVKAAVAAVDENSVALSKAVGSAYPDAEKPFLDSWRQHIGFFVDYTLGKATKNQAKVDKAKTDLDGYRSSFGQLINSVVAELPAQAVADELKPHVASIFATIDSLVAGDGKLFQNLDEAGHHMPMTAAILAGGIADNKKLS